MNLQPVINMRNGLKTLLGNQYFDVPVYTAEITSLVNDEGVNASEFITVFFTAGDETQQGESLDDEDYLTRASLTVGYFNEAGATDQSFLDAEADTIRTLVMDYPVGSKGEILRDGWEYVPAIDGATSGIYFRFTVEYSN